MMRTVLITLLLLAPSSYKEQLAPVRVVATLPIYAEITQQIGGQEVMVSSIANPNEDAHFVRPKPSFALDIRRADMFVTTGPGAMGTDATRPGR